MMNWILVRLIPMAFLSIQPVFTNTIVAGNLKENATVKNMGNETKTSYTIDVVKLNFEEVKMPFLICVVVLLAALSKIVLQISVQLSTVLVRGIWILVLLPTMIEEGNIDENATMKGTENETETSQTIIVAHINFEEVKVPFLICVVVLFAALSKIAFHHVKCVASRVPESCLLIVIGVILGAILHFSGLSTHLPHFFEPHEFFLYLLPPIILEAAFSLHDRVVFNNLGSILTFAVIGTVLACFAVGYTMYGLYKINALGDIELGAVEILIFSSLIVAVDPVAVLAVFEEVGVNNVLYFMVFGESLLNDGVTVVLYNVMHQINKMDHVEGVHIVLGVVTFIVVAGGGALVGIILGLISAVVTKYTKSVRVVEPMAVFLFAYMSFILADTFTLSGIISMIACGVTQMKYTFRNISPKSSTTIKYFTKVLCTATEIVIFLFLGLELVRSDHVFHVGFILWAILLTLVYRFIITFGLTFLLNKDRYRVRKITLQEQFIISYGGLRGAVAFALVGLLEEGDVHSKRLFVTATLSVIIFTVFIQGITIKPLVRLFKVRMAPTEKATLFEEIMGQMTDNIMSGMENIMGYKGNYHIKTVLEFYEGKYLKKWLLRKPDEDEEIMRSYQKVVLRDHLRNLYAGGARIPKSPTFVRALTESDSMPTITFPQEDDTTVVEENGDIGIEMAEISPRRRHHSDRPETTMTSQDMIDLLTRRARNTIHRLSVEEEPDLLHHLKDKHKRVKQLQRNTMLWQSGGEWTNSQRPLSWQVPRRWDRLSARTVASQRPMSAHLESSDFDRSMESPENITVVNTVSVEVIPGGQESNNTGSGSQNDAISDGLDIASSSPNKDIISANMSYIKSSDQEDANLAPSNAKLPTGDYYQNTGSLSKDSGRPNSADVSSTNM